MKSWSGEDKFLSPPSLPPAGCNHSGLKGKHPGSLPDVRSTHRLFTHVQFLCGSHLLDGYLICIIIVYVGNTYPHVVLSCDSYLRFVIEYLFLSQ